MKISNKIFITLIILLIIALSYVTFKYFEMRSIAKENFENYTNALTKIYEYEQ